MRRKLLVDGLHLMKIIVVDVFRKIPSNHVFKSKASVGSTLVNDKMKEEEEMKLNIVDPPLDATTRRLRLRRRRKRRTQHFFPTN